MARADDPVRRMWIHLRRRRRESGIGRDSDAVQGGRIPLDVHQPRR